MGASSISMTIDETDITDRTEVVSVLSVLSFVSGVKGDIDAATPLAPSMAIVAVSASPARSAKSRSKAVGSPRSRRFARVTDATLPIVADRDRALTAQWSSSLLAGRCVLHAAAATGGVERGNVASLWRLSMAAETGEEQRRRGPGQPFQRARAAIPEAAVPVPATVRAPLPLS